MNNMKRNLRIRSSKYVTKFVKNVTRAQSATAEEGYERRASRRKHLR